MKSGKALWRWAPVAAALLLAVGVSTVFGACGPKEDGTWMHCHTAQLLTAGVAVAVAALTALAAIVKGGAARACLYALAVAGCVAAFLMPGTLVTMCMMRTMRCYTALQPFARIMAAITAVAAGVNGARAMTRK